ncbi:hypothetical protein BH09ACT7_BH09ACT7_60120 [soil metagenome]
MVFYVRLAPGFANIQCRTLSEGLARQRIDKVFALKRPSLQVWSGPWRTDVSGATAKQARRDAGKRDAKEPLNGRSLKMFP